MASDPDSGSPKGGRESLNAGRRWRHSIESPPNLPLEDSMNEYLEESRSSQSAGTSSTRADAERKFSRYISESLLLDDGPPARYQLRVKRLNLDGLSDEESNLRRFTVGNKGLRHRNKTVLLVGATGSGKSTLINALVNFVMGVKFEDKVWFEIVPEEKKSPMTAVSVYEVFGFEGKTVPYSLTIIDTPGFRDTRGIEFVDIVFKHLQDLFSIPDGVKTIDAVGLVLKATENSLDERMAYIINSVTSLFGRDMQQNIVALMTHSDWRKPTDALGALDEAKVICARDEKNNPVHFCFNNHQKEKIEDEETGRADLTDLTEFLKQCLPQSPMKTVQVMRSFHLAACFQNLKERNETIKIKQKVIEANKEELVKYEKEMKDNEDFTINVVEHYKGKEIVPDCGIWGGSFYEGATVCKTCEENCHYPGCTHARSPSKCEAMKDGRCTSCSGKCPVEDHVKEDWIYVDNTRTVKKTYREMKARYDENKAQSEEETSLLEDLEKELASLQQQKTQYLYEAKQLNTLNPDSVSTYVQLQSMIAMMMMESGEEKDSHELMDEMNKAHI